MKKKYCNWRIRMTGEWNLELGKGKWVHKDLRIWISCFNLIWYFANIVTCFIGLRFFVKIQFQIANLTTENIWSVSDCFFQWQLEHNFCMFARTFCFNQFVHTTFNLTNWDELAALLIYVFHKTIFSIFGLWHLGAKKTGINLVILYIFIFVENWI